MTSSKSRYMDNHSNGGSNDRYSDRTSSSSSSAWANPNNGPPSSVKSFGGLQSVTNDVWVCWTLWKLIKWVQENWKFILNNSFISIRVRWISHKHMILATGADPLTIKIKTDMIVHSVSVQSTWMGLPEIMEAAAVPAHSSQTPGHKSDSVACLLASMDATKQKLQHFNLFTREKKIEYIAFSWTSHFSKYLRKQTF